MGLTDVICINKEEHPLWVPFLHLEFGCGGRIRTDDLRVMSPTSCRCSTPLSNYTAALLAHPERP